MLAPNEHHGEAFWAGESLPVAHRNSGTLARRLMSPRHTLDNSVSVLATAPF